MSQAYDYPLSSAFPNGTWCKLRLDQEIQNTDEITKVLEATAEVEAGEPPVETVRVTFVSALTGDELVALDRVVAQHTGEPLKTVPDPVILEPTGDNSQNLVMYGESFEADLNTTTNHDVAFDHVRQLQGVSFEITDHQRGDHVRVAVCLPDGTEIRALAEGKNGEGIPVPPGGVVAVVAEGTVEVPAGVLIRIAYTSTAVQLPKPYIHFRLRQWR